jgi:hypothetical protein
MIPLHVDRWNIYACLESDNSPAHVKYHNIAMNSAAAVPRPLDSAALLSRIMRPCAAGPAIAGKIRADRRLTDAPIDSGPAQGEHPATGRTGGIRHVRQ